MTETQVPALDRAMYQRAARAVLTHSLITENYPDTQTLSLVRRWAVPLRADLARLFDYRLELTPTTARLFRVRDALDASQPAMAGAERGPRRSTAAGTPAWRWPSPCWAGPGCRSRCPSWPSG